MDFIKAVDSLDNVVVTDIYNNTDFEFTTHDGHSWYFCGKDAYGRVEVATRHSSKELFNSESQALEYIKAIAK